MECEDCWSKTGYPRDYWVYHFAGLAMQALISEVSWQDSAGTITPKYGKVAEMAMTQSEILVNTLQKD